MKTFFLTIHLIILFSNISFSQSGWIPQQGQTGRHLNDVFFINSMTGWCVSDSDNVQRTTNAGIEWTNQILSGTRQLKSVYFINENTGWCCGGITDPLPSGIIHKTTNSGVNWFTIQHLGGACIDDIFFIDGNTGFRAENFSTWPVTTGNISKTTNGGLNWIGYFLSSQYEFTSISFKNANTGWATGYWWSDVQGDSMVILKTTNAGANWSIKFRERGGEPNDIFSFDNFLWISGKDSSILFSSNDGENWVKQYPGGGRKFNSVFFINESTGWAVGYRYPDTTNIIKSTNGGTNWFDLNNIHGNILNSVFFIDANTGWTVGNSGLILKTTTGGLTKISSNFLQTPSAFNLYQNYPNPFNPVTHLEFGISNWGFVSLKVYDILGNEVKTLVNENKSAGTYEVEFDGSKLPSGVYYYSLYVNDKLFDARKMVLIK